MKYQNLFVSTELLKTIDILKRDFSISKLKYESRIQTLEQKLNKSQKQVRYLRLR
jgi:hypothetical protein